MNFEQLCKIENNYVKINKYVKPILRFKHRHLCIYESSVQKLNDVNYYYIFLSDWFICAFCLNNEVEFLNETKLKERFTANS